MTGTRANHERQATAGTLQEFNPHQRMNPPPTGKYLAIIGACMQAGPLIGLIGTVIGMRQAFDNLGSSGVGDTAQLSNSIGTVLIATVIGIVVGLVGVVLIFVSLLRCRYRAAWFFWFLVIYGAISLLAFPVGTVIGIAFLVYSITNRSQFLAASAPSQPPSTPS